MSTSSTPPLFIPFLSSTNQLPTPRGRPIVSAIKGPLERVGKFVDALIKELVCELPSYVQDTRDVLKKLDRVLLPPGAILVGIDVESLYTSIPHNWGLKAVHHFLDHKFPLLATQNEFIVDLLQFMLEHNCFQFLGKYYRQIRGTSMGAPWASSYACPHLGLWEMECVHSSSMYLGHCLLWLRYIDDVIMVWRVHP